MDKIKAYFKRKTIDKKFQALGLGHKLTSEENIASSVPASSSQSSAAKNYATADKSAITNALNKRLEASTLKDAPQKNAAIKARARKELEEEKRKALSESPPVAPETTTAQDDNAERVSKAIEGVYFTCDIFDDNIYLTKAEMLQLVESKLAEDLHDGEQENAIIASTIMIYSLNSKESRLAAVNILSTYLANVMQSPDNLKFRHIKMSNKRFVENISLVKGAVEFLRACGFVEIDEANEKFLVMPEKSDDEALLVGHLAQCHEFLNNGQPVTLKLYRDIQVFPPKSANFDHQALPQAFFNLSASELKAAQQELKKKVDNLTILQTREMCKRAETKDIIKFKYCLVRIKFPDEFTLQGTFNASDSFENVIKFVRECIVDEKAEFVLKDSNRKLIASDSSLTQSNLAPAALLYFEYEKAYAAIKSEASPLCYLKEELKS